MSSFTKRITSLKTIVGGTVGVIVCGVVVVWLVGLSSQLHHGNALPSQYAGDRDNFTASLKAWSDATGIINTGVQNNDPGGTANHIDTLLAGSIASSAKVGDSFLNYLDPQLKDEYRNHLITGERLYVEGLRGTMPNDTTTSPSATKQMEGNRLENDWLAWWNPRSSALSKKAFAQ